jgi:hypothetical protein
MDFLVIQTFHNLNDQQNIMWYKVVQIWPGQTVTCLHTNRPGHIWTTVYMLTAKVLSKTI